VNLHDLIIWLLVGGIVGFGSGIFYWVTGPSHSWYRIPHTAWLKEPLSIQLIAQKANLLLLFLLILVARLFGEYPGRDILTYTLFLFLVVNSFVFVLLERRVQIPEERATRARLRERRRNKHDHLPK
jgi:hypothetical protein